MIERRRSRALKLGRLSIGAGHPISVQSMCNTDTRDLKGTLAQIDQLEAAGCDLVRLAVMDQEAAQALAQIKKKTTMPLVADIHFDYRLALASLEAGVDGLRINPGNMRNRAGTRQVVREARARKVPIRVGVNSGSVEKELLAKYQGPTAQAMVDSALGHVRILEEEDFFLTKISIKSSDVMTMIEANRLLAAACDYPLHLGVTEAGLLKNASLLSAVGIGTLLAEGIGDTIRVSITGDPLAEVQVAKDILRALGLIRDKPKLISCPTCGRTDIDLIGLAQSVEGLLKKVDKPIRVAVMGCVVNGPGEAREADIGIAGGKKEGLIFRKGRVIKKVPQERLLFAFKEELKSLLKEME